MAETENKNQLATLDQKIAAAKDVNELFMLPDVKQRFIRNYEAVTGKKDGENRLEQERFAYLQLIADRPELKEVSKFYHFAALVYAGTTGLSFRDNKLYVIPNGKGGLKVQSSPAGKREMFCMMPDVVEAPEAVLVMKGDHFVYDKLNNVVKEHYSTDKTSESITLDNIRASYQRIKYKNNMIKDVVVYHDELVKAKTKTKMKGDMTTWTEWPGEMAKKTATNRAFRLYHRYPDNVVLYSPMEEDPIDTTHEDVSEGYEPQQPEQQRTDVDMTTGEEIQPEVVDDKKEKRRKNLLAD